MKVEQLNNLRKLIKCNEMLSTDYLSRADELTYSPYN